MRTGLSDEALARRRPVWAALSELFLDTELQQDDLARIAAALRSSGFAPDELDEICREEVAPVLSANLRSVAGVWSGFDEAWLVRTIVDRLAHPSAGSRLRRALGLRRRRGLAAAEAEWRAVRLLLETG